MDIDPHTLPEEASLLRQIVLQLLGVVEEKDRLLERVQHQLKQLLRQRYGQKRERIDENQLFLFAAQIIAASQASAASGRPEPPPARCRAGLAGGDDLGGEQEQLVFVDALAFLSVALTQQLLQLVLYPLQ